MRKVMSTQEAVNSTQKEKKLHSKHNKNNLKPSVDENKVITTIIK